MTERDWTVCVCVCACVQGCHGDLVAVICTALVNVSFLLLFCQFYVSTYKRPRPCSSSSTRPDAPAKQD